MLRQPLAELSRTHVQHSRELITHSLAIRAVVEEQLADSLNLIKESQRILAKVRPRSPFVGEESSGRQWFAPPGR
jgi:hypothetical protein